MRIFSSYAKILCLTGCLVFLGLNAAAQGLQKMAPGFPQHVFAVTMEENIWSVTAIGTQYQWDVSGMKDLARALDAKAREVPAYLRSLQVGEKTDAFLHTVKQSFFPGVSALLNKGRDDLARWSRQCQEILWNRFNQEKTNIGS
ncbi:hypothetical protein [Candidatus Formimonas warabiya]|uniref:Uncharacterized protein n=1 Tax=Formimonas warabiya TaxID=1761012 RepID=A0A3G1KSB9_FORW1|nr:hypothetical protein [Candidatus Formimonas warabiya]ATW25359.1 hypothetical protein DCMF_11795 [Candidatus Formimonas warabiya]